MLQKSGIGAGDALASQWRNAGNYNYMKALPASGCAWEALRRNLDYRKAWHGHGSDPNQTLAPNSRAAEWGLLRFEPTGLDARSANVFWRRSVSRDVLPLIASKREAADPLPELSLCGLQCRVTVQSDELGKQHVLFAEEGRSLQLEVDSRQGIETAQLATGIVLSPRLLTARLQGLRRFADVMTHRRLRPCLYPPDKRAARFARLLQVLDAWNAGASYREMALAIFGEPRTRLEWHAPHLRDHLRRALNSGRSLVNGGYRRILS